MVRAGKTGKGFTPQPSPQDILDVAAEKQLLSQIARKILENRAAALIQRAWRSRNQGLLDAQQKETGKTLNASTILMAIYAAISIAVILRNNMNKTNFVKGATNSIVFFPSEQSGSNLLSSFSQESFYQSKKQCLQYASKQQITKLIKVMRSSI